MDISGKPNPYFDAPYGQPSITVTTGNTVIATTGGFYLGCAIVSTVASTLRVYDNGASASGRLLDIFGVVATTAVRNDLRQVIVAKNGFSVNLTGAGASAVIYFAPKG